MGSGRILWDVFFFLPIVFLLRTAYLIIPYALATFEYTYWLYNDVLPQFTTFFIVYLLRLLVLPPLYTLRGVINFIQVLCSIATFIRNLILQPGGRSFYQILTNPRYKSEINDYSHSYPSQIKRKVRRQYHARGKKYIASLPENLYIHTTYQTCGGYMHVGTNVNQESLSGLAKANKQVYEVMRDMLHVPYHHVLVKFKKPPWNHLVESFFSIGVFNIIILAMTLIGLYRIVLIRWFPCRARRLIDALSPPV